MNNDENDQSEFIKLGNSINGNYFAIENYLRGVGFPSTKQELINHAEKNSASNSILNILGQFSERIYAGPADIFHEASKIE